MKLLIAQTCRLSISMLLLAIVPAWQSNGGTDFLIVEKVDRLVVYNKYQQEATARERQSLVPLTPMRIVKADDVLGDGFTRCTQVDVFGETFYLLKDKDGTLSRSGPLGFERIFSKTTVLYDSVRLLTSVTFSSVDQKSRRSLPAATTVRRIFRHQSSTFCQILSTQPEFGWVDFTRKKEGRDWTAIRTPVTMESPIPLTVVEKVQAKLNEVNRVLARLFEYFNNQTHPQKKVPRWSLQASEKLVVCTLQGSAGNDEFRQSTLYLVNDIENTVLSTRLQVTHTPGRIEIRSK